jgi:putative redox protein
MINSFIGAEKYKVTHNNGRHKFYADEPVEKGGMDIAPTPDELLESALASCTLVTLRMYTDHKQWQVGKMDLSVSLKREEGKTIITRQLKFEHQLSDDQMLRLIQVAKNCPVSKTLGSVSELNVEII